MKKDDSLWKGILEDVFPYFLHFFYPGADALFDFDKDVTFLDKELNELFPTPEHGAEQRFVDKLAKIFLKSGQEQWILIHIEVQNSLKGNFPERMYEYQYRIRDRYHRPVIAFAIISGKRKKPVPDAYTYSLLGTSLTYRYNTFLIAAQEEASLAASNNPFAMVVLIAKKAIDADRFSDDYLLSQNKELARLLFSKRFSQKIVRSIMVFLKHYVHFENREYYTNFDKEVEILTSNKKTMGIEELILERARKSGQEVGEKIGEKRGEKIGEKRGEKRGEKIGQKIGRKIGEKRAEERAAKRFVTSLLKNTDFSDKKIAEMAHVTVAFVTQVKATLKK